jgi:N,N'-diacetyllegionaminate synthase
VSFSSSPSSSDLNSRCLVIAEAGVNHNGDPALAAQLVDAAFAAGADAVKFQTFSAEKLVCRGAKTAAYQRANAGETDQFAMLRRLELPIAELERLAARCRDLGTIEFMSTPFDRDAADELVGIGMRRIKIPSGEITNLPFLSHLAGKRLPLIVSTGMATLAEVEEVVNVIDAAFQRENVANQQGMLTLLHCTSNYPTEPTDVNLRAMATLQERFRRPVGYSDHTAGILVPPAAVAMGARVIEKHLTLDRGLPGPDHRASLEPDEFKEMVRQIRFIEQCLGDGVKAPRSAELPVRDVVRRSIVTARALDAGQCVEAADLTLLRPGTGLAPRDLPRVIGCRAKRAVPVGTLLSWDDLHV